MVGFAIYKRQRTVDAGLVEKFKSIPVANISDSMNRMTGGGPRLRPMHGSGGLCGVAITVKSRPGDNLMVHKALDIAGKGDVVVVDAGGDLTNSIMGEMMAAYAQFRQIEGIVIDGSIRDYASIHAGTFPIFAAGVTHRGPYKDGPGEINVPIAVDGMVIEPGDLIVGDEDGLLCIPYAHAADIYKAAYKKIEVEKRDIIKMRDGSRDRKWVDETLKRLGCVVEQ
jgi:regulator of RNase E activity RraA